MSSSTLLRSSGLALIAGSVLSLISSAGVPGFWLASLPPSAGSLGVTLALLLDNLGWLMLAVGLLALGIYLLRQSNEEDRLTRLFAALGAGSAIVSAAGSLVGLFALVMDLGTLARGTLPGSMQAVFGGAITVSVFGGIAIASVSLRVALLCTRHLGWWWVLLPVLGLLTAPRILGLVLGILSAPAAGMSFDSSLVLSLGIYALVTGGWVVLGFLLAFRTGERCGGSSRVA